MKRNLFKNGHSFLICGWMSRELGLTGLKREVYAIIFQFSQGGSIMVGNCKEYLADATDSSILTIKRIIKELISDGYIKEKIDEKGNIGYSATLNLLD